MSFEKMVEDLHVKIQGVNRYNPENVTDLIKCVDRMVTDRVYDKDICLTVLKLFQLNPDKFNENTVKLVLMKTMTMLPSSDFALAKCLIDSNRVAGGPLKLVLDLGCVLESCDFSTFWKLMKGTYKPSTDPNERFKIPQEVPRLVATIPGFEEGVRQFVCRVIGVTFQTIDKPVLVRFLGGATDAQLKEYSEKYEWSQDEKNPEVYFIANHEEKIRSRNIDEKLQFSDMIAVLRSIPKPLVPKSGKD